MRVDLRTWQRDYGRSEMKRRRSLRKRLRKMAAMTPEQQTEYILQRLSASGHVR